jgi:hypothetical protein|nr:MAG TPA: hypothetical protein [Caudoviricetes sp.]
MLKTNSKEVMNRIKKVIMDSYEAAEEYYTFDGSTMKTEYNDICKDIMNMFYIEKLQFDNRYKAGRISKSDLFMDWMQGLPSAFPVSNDIFLSSAVDFLGDLLDETETEKEKFTDEQAEKRSVYLLFRELEKHAKKA